MKKGNKEEKEKKEEKKKIQKLLKKQSFKWKRSKSRFCEAAVKKVKDATQKRRRGPYPNTLLIVWTDLWEHGGNTADSGRR